MDQFSEWEWLSQPYKALFKVIIPIQMLLIVFILQFRFHIDVLELLSSDCG